MAALNEEAKCRNCAHRRFMHTADDDCVEGSCDCTLFGSEYVTVLRGDLRNVLDNADLEWCQRPAEDRLRAALEGR